MARITSFFKPFSNTNKQTQQSVTVSWSYVASVIALLFSIVSICGIFLWYLAYGIDHDPPRNLSLNNISTPAEINWHADGSVTIHSENESALVSALGYAHASINPWQMMLWRQTAQGNLTAWFGPGLLRVDRLAKQLRIASISRNTYENLPEHQRRLLDDYANGVNAAINQQNLLAHDDFAFLDADVYPWKPWHTLAVERLFAWLTTNFNEVVENNTEDWIPDSTSAYTSLSESDAILRGFLQIHDFKYTYAGTWKDPDISGASYFYQRLIYGASAHSIVQEIGITNGQFPDLFLATIPGTLTFLSGHGKNHSWALLPRSDLQLTYESSEIGSTISHERITNREGTEFLATFEHYPGFLVLSGDKASSDSLLTIHWNGFQEGTDSFVFLNLLKGEKPGFHLLKEDGLWMSGSRALPLGAPAYIHSFENGMLVGSTPWTSFTAAHLDSLYLKNPDALNPKTWSSDCYSPWAANVAPALLASLSDTNQLSTVVYRDAITYLRNWDYSFTSSSIGAAIFEAWLRDLGYTAAESRLSFSPDSIQTSLAPSFKRAIDYLNTSYGEDLSQWRLEQTSPVRRYFPAWDADSLYSPDSTPLSKTNYAPLEFPGKGNVATLCWGSFSSEDFASVSAQWESWSMRKDEKIATYWRKHVTPDSFLERYLISNRPSLSFRYTTEASVATTHLIPDL